MINNSIQRVIRAGLTYWIKSLCKSIDDLQLNIKIIFLGFFSYKLKQTSLSAKNIIFNNLYIDHINVESDSIKINLNPIQNKNNLISIENNFQIKANLLFKEMSINNILKDKESNSLVLLLTEFFFKDCEFVKVNFKNNIFTIKVIDRITKEFTEKYFLIEVRNGSLYIIDKENLTELALPIDKNINVNKASLEKDQLSVLIESNVKL